MLTITEEKVRQVVNELFEKGSICSRPILMHAFTTADAAIALEIAVGSRMSDPDMDVSGDARVTSLDALVIMQAAAGNL